MAPAASEIRDSRLYRAEHGTFEAYCRERWGWGRHRANRMTQASEVAGDSVPMGTIQNERQARELARAPEEIRAEVMERVRESGEKVTAKAIRGRVGPCMLFSRQLFK